MGRSVCKQPGTKVDGILSQQGGFPSKYREMEERQRGIRKGKQKARGCAIITLSVYMHVHNDCL
jgi:hypothetical protein